VISHHRIGAAAAGIVLAAAVFLSAAPAALAQFQEIDLGSPDPIDVLAYGDPLSLVHIPPGAFGDHPPGTIARIGIDIPICNGPNCLGGRALLVSYDDGGCCGSGALVLPVIVQVRYDEEEVRRFGIAEEDVVIAKYDADHRVWIPFSAQSVDVDQNVVRAAESQSIRLFVAAFAAAPQPVAPASWGRIKSLFRDDPSR
jgi:hypothetical protein